MLAVLEGYGTALAAPCMGEADVARLTEINDEMAAAMAELDSLRSGASTRSSTGSSTSSARTPRSSGCCATSRARLDAIRRTVFVQIPYRGSTSVAEHKELIELIASGAPAAKIEKAAREHKLSTVRSFRAFQDERAPSPAPSTAAPAAARAALDRVALRQQRPDLRVEASLSGASGSRANADGMIPSSRMIHFAGTGLTSVNAASTSACSS